MRIKLDENMPTELTAVLAEQGHVVDTVMDEGLKSRRTSMCGRRRNRTAAF